MTALDIRLLTTRDLDRVTATVRELGGDRPRSLYERYLSEREAGTHAVFVGLLEGAPAGYVTLNRRPGYPPFRYAGIPEIQDLNVLPRFRRRGVATSLLERAEREAARESDTVGIGVGLSADYGIAQRLYVLRGFVPDGRGLPADLGRGSRRLPLRTPLPSGPRAFPGLSGSPRPQPAPPTLLRRVRPASAVEIPTSEDGSAQARSALRPHPDGRRVRRPRAESAVSEGHLALYRRDIQYLRATRLSTGP